MKHLLPTVLATAAALAVSQAAAKELTVASWVGPSHPTIANGYSVFFPKVADATKGAVTFKLISGGALMSGKDTLTGLGDGIADASVLALTYNPAQLPADQLVAELAMQSGDALAVAAAVTEFTMLACAPCLAEFKKQNIVYTGSYATAPYALISKTPMATPDDLKGKRIRSPGGAWDRWIAESGATVVHTSSSEMYEALDKGIIDIAMQPAAALKTQSLWDVAHDLTQGSFGVYNSGPLLAFNRSTWAALSTGDRRIILENMAEAIVATTEGYLKTNDAALAAAAEHGVKVIDKPAAMEDWIRSFNDKDMGAVIAKAGDTYHVEDAQTLVASYREILKKWEAKVSGGMSRDELIAAMKSEIFDKIDADSYGL